uniref:Ig-like domain-containing protein n=1 Tax=Oryzias latipes TaxID=8090 RepID=A0A3P9KAI8_ORYLA
MIRGLATFILLGGVFAIETLELPEEIPLIEAELGDNVTFTCSSRDFDQALMYWYKFQYGYVIHTILKSSFGKFNEHFDDSKIYAVKKNDDKLILTIKNVSKEDEAAYFCQAGSSYNMEFINGIHLFVKGPKNELKSGSVKPSPKLELVLLGNTVNLQCSVLSEKNLCARERRVYWYKAGSKSPADILHATSPSCDDQEGRCVYNLSKTIQTFSDCGVYTCAVVSCGEIMFGEGTKVQMAQDMLCTNAKQHISIFGTLLACSILANIALFLARKRQKGVFGLCKGDAARSSQAEQLRSAEDQPNHGGFGETEMCYAALDFTPGQLRRPKITENPAEDYIYSQTIFKRRVREE